MAASSSNKSWNNSMFTNGHEVGSRAKPSSRDSELRQGQNSTLQKKVNGFKKQAQSHHTTLDLLEGEVKAFLIDEDELHTFDDLTKVNPVTSTTVLKCLHARYSADVFYTHAGCTLVAVNPFKHVPCLYSLEVMKEYHVDPQPQELKPHVFILAERAYRNVQGQVEPVNQSLIVSGESGAGKTWTSRCLMKYYATVAASSSSQKCQDMIERIERRVLESNPVMEAFGNARTLRNNNSSRFGKYIQLQLNRSQQLVGASIQTYLLEKTRVTCQATSERNFHIFYQIMKGATEQERLQWKLPGEAQFCWLPNADQKLEEDCFEVTKDAMLHLGITSRMQRQIFRILAGLLHLGNIQFSAPANESQPCELDTQSKGFLQTMAVLLKVPQEEVLAQLLVRTIRAGRQQQVFMKPCSQTECGMRRDCLAKVIYAKVFDWLVTFINGSICANSSRWSNFIGLLDVYGFESFVLNNLEQLCINYANEKLQQHFVAHYLKAQQEEYAAEGLEWSFVSYQDNQSCLDLIEGSPTSIFSLLNEECRLNRLFDAKQFKTRLEKALSSNACLSWDKFKECPHFIVSHYAGTVSYQIEGMMEKNKDPVPLELIQLLQKSQDSLLQDLFVEQKEQNDNRGQSKVITVVSKFKSSLESLMHILHSTTPHYTRCIKPNSDCRPMTFKKEEVITQLEACGIVETINISAAGFPLRLPYQSFMDRYGLIQNPQQLYPVSGVNGASPAKKKRGLGAVEAGEDALGSAVRDIINVATSGQAVSSTVCGQPENKPSSSLLVHCGKTKIFMTHSMLELLESVRSQALSRRAFCIQRCWRRYLRRKQARQQRAANRIQAVVRSWLTRRWIARRHKAAQVIQRAWRTWRTLMDALAAAELDDTMELEEQLVSVQGSPVRAVKGFTQSSAGTPQAREPVVVQSWPFGLALSSAPCLSMTVTASGLQKVMSLLACLKLSFGNANYKVETNQFSQGIASVRAQPQETIKLHLRRSPLLYADVCPGKKSDHITGYNQILLEKA
ncbi:unconventional myosin-XIX-like [Huso huso]|uniref:Unconventional myosin-XIX-like n=1 Tax=Huso huso TaxID=61971 RepID=A0ABR0YLA3_HUSHU